MGGNTEWKIGENKGKELKMKERYG